MSPFNPLKVGIPQGGALSLFFTFFLSEKKYIHLHGTPVLNADNLQVTCACKADEINTLKDYFDDGAFKIGNYCQYLGLWLN